METTSIKQIVEGLIFAADEPLTPGQIRELVEGESSNGESGTSGLTPQKLQTLVNELNGEYEREGKPYRIQSIAGGFIFSTNSNVSKYVGKLHKEQSKKRLTQVALETLAIIAYKQPITKVELETIRGVNSDYIVKSLLERDLITIVGRQQTAGRPLLYGTTNRFLMHFGLNSIKELPKPREIEELIGETELEVEKRMLELEKQKQEEEEDIAQKKERKPHPLSENAMAKIIPLKPDYRPLKIPEPEPEPEREEDIDDTQDRKREDEHKEDETEHRETQKDEEVAAESDDLQTDTESTEQEHTPDIAEDTDTEHEKEQTEIEQIEEVEEPTQEYITTEEHQPVDEQMQPERGWKKWKNKIVKIIKKMFG